MAQMRDAKKDSRLIRTMANNGYTTADVIRETGLNRNQIYYSVKRWYPEPIAKKIFQTLKDNRKKKKPAVQSGTTSSNAQKSAVMFDTSIANVKQLIGNLNEMENVVFLFPSVVVEELEKMTKFADFRGYNSRELLRIAISANSEVLLTPTESTLTGWSNNNKDSLIIQTAIEASSQFDFTLFTCDKVLALKAKSLGLKYKYFESDSMPFFSSTTATQQQIVSQRKQENFVPFCKVEYVNEVRTLELAKQKSFYYISTSNSFPYYYMNNSGRIISITQKKVFLSKGDTIYKVYSDRVEKYVLQSFDKTNNACLVNRGVFATETQGINSLRIAMCIKALD